MKEIQLSQHRACGNRGKYVALVDDEDFEYLNQFKWSAHTAGKTFYAERKIRYEGGQYTQFMHNAIMGRKGVDHKDHNGINNQKSNLRFCTHRENMMNTRKQENTSSMYKGVCFFKRDKNWLAYVTINGKRIHLGYFETEIEAAKAYNAKAIELFCEFANLNIVDK